MTDTRGETAKPAVRGGCCHTGGRSPPDTQWSGPAVGSVTWNAGWEEVGGRGERKAKKGGHVTAP